MNKGGPQIGDSSKKVWSQVCKRAEQEVKNKGRSEVRGFKAIAADEALRSVTHFLWLPAT